jgi:hypothetical protein
MPRFVVGVAYLSLLVALGHASTCRGQPTSPPATQARERYEQQLSDLVTKHLESLIAARVSYIESLQSVRQQAVQQGDLEEGLKVGKLIKEVQSQLELDRARLSFLLPRAVFEIKGTAFALKVLRNEATAFSNRDYVWRDVPKELDGWRFTQIAGGDTPEIELEIQEGGVVFVATADAKDLQDAGWQKIEGLALRYSQAGSSPMAVLAKQFQAGDKLKIVHRGWTGTIVLVPDVTGKQYIRGFLKRYLMSLRVPSDALEFEGHWYKHCLEPATWAAAEKRCEEMGGHLACVTSKKEHDFVVKLISGKVTWLGGTDAETEGQWRWITGEPFQFRAWLPGEPNNVMGREHALTYGGYDRGRVGWVDWYLEGRASFVCEWSPDLD